MARLSLFLLGGFEARLDEIPISGLKTDKSRALLAYLAVEQARPHRRQTLAGLLWPGYLESSARASLRHALANLRQVLSDEEANPPFLLIEGETIQLNRAADLWVDVWEFEKAIREQGAGISEQHPTIANHQSTILNLQSAISLYRGAFLEGFTLPDSTEFDTWLSIERESLQRQALSALYQLAEENEQQGQLEGAIGYARRQLELEPWLEEAHRQVMRLLAQRGQRAAALAQYEACRKALADELQVEPSPETKRLYEAIRSEDMQGIKGKGIGEKPLAPIPHPLPPEPGESPFKGLQYFDVDDADLFFGREALTARLVGHMREMADGGVGAGLSYIQGSLEDQEDLPLQFLAVVGASGSGKSSVVRAGMVPALQSGKPLADGSLPPEGSPGWHIHVITPTAHPLEALAVSLTRDSESVTAATTLVDDLSQEARSLNMVAQKILAHNPSPAGRGRSSEARSRVRAAVNGRLLLVVDQLEELFILCRSEAERTAFLDNLLTAVQSGGPTQVIVVLRADFYAHCAQYPRLRQALCARQEYIGPMDAGELRRAIEEPARQNDWELEPGLVDLFLRDVGASEDHPPEPGALPLLEHALLETWNRRSGRTLTHQGYADAGGVHGAIAKTAEGVFNRLTPEQQALARRIFLRLTELGEGTQDTRRRTPLVELALHPEDMPKVDGLLNILADARLITLAEGTAEVAHEALIREWPALRQWLNEDREGLQLQHRLTASAEAWAELEREAGELYRGARLAQALEWAEGHPDDPNQLEREFLQASQEQANREMTEQEAQRRRELDSARQVAETARKLARTQRQRSLVLSVGLALAVILIGVALWLNYRANTSLGLAEDAQQTAQAEAMNRATQQARAEYAQGTAQADAISRATLQAMAENQSSLARSRELAAAAVNKLYEDPQLSLLLANEAYNVADSNEAESALRQIVLTTRPEKILMAFQSSGVKAVAYSPDGQKLAAIDDKNYLRVFDTEQNSQLLNQTLDYSMRSDDINDVEFFPDGRLVVRGDYQFAIFEVKPFKRLMTGVASATGVQVVDRIQGKTILEVKNADDRQYPLGVGYTPNGLYLVSVSVITQTAAAEITIRNLDTPQRVVTIHRPDNSSGIEAVKFNLDGTRMALPGDTGEIEIWDLSAGILLRKLTGMPVGLITAMTYSPDGSMLAAAGAMNTVKVWDLASGREILPVNGSTPLFSADGQRLIVTGANQQVNIWDIASRKLLYNFMCHPVQTKLILRPDGQQVASAGADGKVHLCEVSPASEYRTWVSGSSVEVIDYSPVQGLLGIAGADNVVRIYDAETGEMRRSIRPPAGSQLKRFAFLRDGARFVTLDTRATRSVVLRIWDTATGEELAYTFVMGSDALLGVSPNGNLIFSQSLTFGTMGAEYESATLNFSNFGYTGQHTLAVYSPDSTHLALANTDGTVSIYERPYWLPEKTLNISSDIRAMAYSPDGSRLAVAAQKGQVAIWSTRTGEKITTLQGEIAAMDTIAYSPDGQLLATGGLDGTVRIWQAETGREMLPLPRHEAGVTLLAFTLDGRRLVNVSEDGDARVTLIRIEDILEIARQRIRREFTAEEQQRYHLTSLAPVRQATTVPAAASAPMETPTPLPTPTP